MEIKTETITRRYIEFNGLRFYPDKKGYWLGHDPKEKKPVRLHVYVWEYYNGKIPEGYQVHHIDHNRDNNEIENLQLMSKAEHLKYHSALQDKEWARMNLELNARPKASEWHGSDEGRAWHSKHGKEVAAKMREDVVERICQCCGKPYTVLRAIADGSRFCSANCKAQWRRDAGIDDTEVSCPICGAKFFTNKYARKKYCSIECRKIAITAQTKGKPKPRKSKRGDDLVAGT